jgi:hypothetical protein
MLARVGRLVREPAVEAAASTLLGRRLAAQQRNSRLTPVPLAASSSLQMAAIDTAARYLLQET